MIIKKFIILIKINRRDKSPELEGSDGSGNKKDEKYFCNLVFKYLKNHQED